MCHAFNLGLYEAPEHDVMKTRNKFCYMFGLWGVHCLVVAFDDSWSFYIFVFFESKDAAISFWNITEDFFFLIKLLFFYEC